MVGRKGKGGTGTAEEIGPSLSVFAFLDILWSKRFSVRVELRIEAKRFIKQRYKTMASTKVNAWTVDGDQISVDVLVTETSYRGNKATVRFKGTGAMADVIAGFVAQQKISHSGLVEEAAYETINCDRNKATDEDRKAVKPTMKALVAEFVNGQTIDPFNLEKPRDPRLKKLEGIRAGIANADILMLTPEQVANLKKAERELVKELGR
jgi:hypothetical protein